MTRSTSATFSTDDVRIYPDGECVFVDTPVGRVQIGVYSDTPHDLNVCFVGHVRLGITGTVRERPTVEVDSWESPTDVVIKDSERAFNLSDRREESNNG